MKFIFIHKDESEDHYLNVPDNDGLEGMGSLVLVKNVEQGCLDLHLIVTNREEFTKSFYQGKCHTKGEF